jgi:hypothetical protein
VKSYLKNSQHKKGLVAQVIKCLPSKCEALNSNSITTKKKKKQLSETQRQRTGMIYHSHEDYTRKEFGPSVF